jgi:hypothetical protein
MASLAVSCDDKESGKAPGPITAITHQPDYGAITFEWQQPADENYYYTDIRYVIDGVEHSKKVSKYRDSTTIEGLISADPVDFTFHAVSHDGAYSEPFAYTAAAYTPPFDLVIETVDITPDVNSVLVSWENTTGKRVTVEVAYTDRDGNAATSSFNATETGSALIANLVGAPAKLFTVVVRDTRQNTSEARNFNVDVMNAIFMNRDNWSFPGYDGSSRYETIGYSSQALNEATTTFPVNGSVLAMLDGEVNSFWHAAWSNPVTAYPHWFIIDLGREVTVTHVEMTRRQNNATGQTGFQILTCPASAATNPADPTTWAWEEQIDVTSFSQSVLTPQQFRLPANPLARYIKVFMDTRHKGTGAYAIVAEFGIYVNE